MSLFYAYFADYANPAQRRLITFITREAADEWWRFISTHSSYAGTVKRVSPQFYIRDGTKSTVNTSAFFASPDTKHFLEKMFFSYLYDENNRSMSIAPPVKITDHISGNWYFIRSVDDPQRHWYTRLSGRCLVCREDDCDAVHVSTEHRTRFNVQVHNPAFKAPKDFVMIGSDGVSIAASKDYVVRIDDAEELKITKVYQIASSHLLFLFKDIKNRFVTRAEEKENGDICEYVIPVERGLGEAWGLSD